LFTPVFLSFNAKRALNEELVNRFSRWLVALDYSDCAIYKYPRTVHRFAAFIHPAKLLKVNHFDIQEFLALSAAEGQTPKLVREHLYALRVFFDFLNLGGLIKWVPPRMVKMRPMRRTIPKVLTQDQLNKVMGAACTKHERALVELLYGSGCRTGELRTMRVENVDFDHKRIRVTGKTGTRVLMFTSTAGKALRDYLGKRKDGFVFVEQKLPQRVRPQRTPEGGWYCRWKVYDEQGQCALKKAGYIRARESLNYRQAVTHFSKLSKNDRLIRPVGLRPLAISAIQQAVHKIGLRVGMRINPYSFRHTFATHLLDNGADLRVIQELLGHRSIRTTEIYAHVSKKQVQRTFEQCHPRK
jgi:site-specific recombinase XerD